MSKEFEGQVVIVTGSSSGIGEETAVMFAQRGAMVTLTGRDEDRLKAAMERCLEAGGGHKDRYLTVAGDINDKDCRKQIIDKTMEKFGHLDVLVPIAGIFLNNDTIFTATEENFDAIVNTNLKSVFFLIQEAVPHLTKSKGCIVTMSSLAAQKVSPVGIVYSMGKAALEHMSRILSICLAPNGIRVNTISPTLVENTKVFRDIKENLESFNAYLDKYASFTPLEGRASTLEEQAEVILFLASKAARFVSGECIKVDGAISQCWLSWYGQDDI